MSGKERFRLLVRQWLGPVLWPVQRGPLAGWRLSVLTGVRFLRGNYEKEKIDVFRRWVRTGDFVIDVGAHAGFFTLLGVKLAGRKGLVWSFEPRPSNRALLELHLKANAVTQNTVRVFPLAVADRVGAARFDDKRGSGTGRLANEGTLSVAVTMIDALTLPKSPSLIKIDIEGGEVPALLGAEQTITSARPTLLVATHGEREHEGVMGLLDRWNYKSEVLVHGDETRDTEILAVPAERASELAS